MNYILNTIIMAVALHFVGDYLLQIDFIASTKGKNWYHLVVHCVLYSFVFYIYKGFSLPVFLWLFITHMIIDALKARYKKIGYVTDQVLHYIILIPVFFLM